MGDTARQEICLACFTPRCLFSLTSSLSKRSHELPGVPRDAVDAVVVSRAVRALPGSTLFEASEAVRAGIEARRVIRSRATASETRSIFATDERVHRSLCAPGVFQRWHPPSCTACSLSPCCGSLPEHRKPRPSRGPNPRLVFLALPGPGGGGGGGGLRNPLPPRAAETPSAFPRPRPAPDASPNKAPIVARQIEVRRPTPAPVPTPLRLPSLKSRFHPGEWLHRSPRSRTATNASA